MIQLRWSKTLASAVLLITLIFLVVGCGTQDEPTRTAAPSATEQPALPSEETDEPAAAAELHGDPIRGGLLYDKWWAVLAVDESGGEHEHEEEEEHEAEGPDSDHPLWATQDTNTRSGSDTWRCKECHGWDYRGVDGAYGSGSHMTGFPGVFDNQDQDPMDILAALQGSTNADHDFSSVMAEQDLIDLTLFISDSLMDYSVLINDDKSSVGDMSQGATLYGQVCIACHGPTGKAINFGSLDDPEFLGHLAPDNPWEFVHKVRFGQPGWPMPSAINNGWSDEDIADVLAYAQTFNTEVEFSGGGQLYDSWWALLGIDAPTEDHPLWATQSTNERSGSDTWRCKECHGWDYMGVDGAYGSGSHFTGFTGILDTPADQLMSWLDGSNNSEHDFTAVMDPFALEALITFMSEEMADITPYVTPDGSVSGDPAHGRELFNGTCAACHGVDGKAINFHDAEEPEYIGTVASGNPWEFFHKASFGQPGAPMPVGRALGWTMQDIADVLSYAQTLPVE